MRKFLTLIFVSLFYNLVSVSAQKFERLNSVGLGVSFANIDALESSTVGWGMDCTGYGFHLDFKGNLETGAGEYLEFQSSETFSTNKRSWFVFNFGYAIPLVEWLYITPKLGFVSGKDIYEDYIGETTHFSIKNEELSKTQFAIDVTFLLNDAINLPLYFSASIGTVESFSFALGWAY